MVHGPPTEQNTAKSEGFKTKLGLIMFAIYTAIYVGFIFIAVTDPKLMGAKIGGLNLAVVYGFGLIIFAIIQALVYNYICSQKEKQDEGCDDGGEAD